MLLSEKERSIIRYIGNQEYCLLSDIKRHFFKSDSSCSSKLRRLKTNGYIQTMKVSETKISQFLNEKSENKKIVFLNNRGLKEIQKKKKPSLIKVNHQVLLSSLKENLEKYLDKKGLYEGELRDLKGTLLGNNGGEPYPDFFIEKDDFKLAIELELNLKSVSRYNKKISNYNLSRFTHVLYVTLDKKINCSLLDILSYEEKFSVADYRNFKEVFCFSFGNKNLKDWLKSVSKGD